MSLKLTDADLASIKTLLAAQDAAWNAGDASAFGAALSDDAVFTNVMGMFIVGRDPFIVQHERIFSTFFKGSRLVQQLAHVTVVRADVLAVDIVARVTDYVEPPRGITPVDGAVVTRLLQVLAKDGEDWRVVAFHNVAVQPFVAAMGA